MIKVQAPTDVKITQCSWAFGQVLIIFIYAVLLYVIMAHIARNLSLLREQLQQIQAEGVHMMQNAVHTKYTMFRLGPSHADFFVSTVHGPSYSYKADDDYTSSYLLALRILCSKDEVDNADFIIISVSCRKFQGAILAMVVLEILVREVFSVLRLNTLGKRV